MENKKIMIYTRTYVICTGICIQIKSILRKIIYDRKKLVIKKLSKEKIKMKSTK